MQLVWPDRVVDLQRGTFVINGPTERLTAKETEVLQRLAQVLGRPVSQETLEKEVWGLAPGVRTQTVPVTLRRLRGRLGRDVLVRDEEGWRLTRTARPMKLPDGPFIERLTVCSDIEARFSEGWPRVLIHGPPGCGRSRIALAWAETESNVVWVDGTPNEGEVWPHDGLIVFDGIDAPTFSGLSLPDTVRVLVTAHSTAGWPKIAQVPVPELTDGETRAYLKTRAPAARMPPAGLRWPGIIELGLAQATPQWSEAAADYAEALGLPGDGARFLARVDGRLTEGCIDRLPEIRDALHQLEKLALATRHPPRLHPTVRHGLLHRESEADSIAGDTLLVRWLQSTWSAFVRDPKSVDPLPELLDDGLAVVETAPVDVAVEAARLLVWLLSHAGATARIAGSLVELWTRFPDDPRVQLLQARRLGDASRIPTDALPPSWDAFRVFTRTCVVYQRPLPPVPQAVDGTTIEDRALLDACSIVATADSLEDLETLAQQCLVRATGLPVLQILTVKLTASALTSAGHRLKAQTWLEDLLRLVEQHGMTRDRTYAIDQLATCVALLAPGRARRLWTSCAQLAEEQGDTRVVQGAHTCIALLDLVEGSDDAALRRLSPIREEGWTAPLQEQRTVQAVLAVVLALNGHHDDARRVRASVDLNEDDVGEAGLRARVDHLFDLIQGERPAPLAALPVDAPLVSAVLQVVIERPWSQTRFS